MQRLPGLASSRLMEDTLSGRNELIDFDDIFNGIVNITKLWWVIGWHVLLLERVVECW